MPWTPLSLPAMLRRQLAVAQFQFSPEKNPLENAHRGSDPKFGGLPRSMQRGQSVFTWDRECLRPL